MPPLQRNPANIRTNLMSTEARVYDLHFLLLIVWVYLHSIFCGGLRKTHLFWNRIRISRSRSSKVVDFGTNRKGVCDFLLVINSNFGHILHRFWDTDDLLAENCDFFLPHSHLTPSLGVNPIEFLDKTYRAKTRGMGLLYVKHCMILTSAVFACDRQTERQRDAITIAYARLAYMLSRAKT